MTVSFDYSSSKQFQLMRLRNLWNYLPGFKNNGKKIARWCVKKNMKKGKEGRVVRGNSKKFLPFPFVRSAIIVKKC